MLANYLINIRPGVIVVSGIVFLAMVYLLSINRTIDRITEYAELARQIKAKNEQLANMDVNASNSTEYAWWGNNRMTEPDIIKNITSYCAEQKIAIRKLPATKVRTLDEAQLETYAMIVSANYKSIVKLIYHLEQEQKLGNVTHANLEIKKDRISKRKFLEAEIILRRIAAAG